MSQSFAGTNAGSWYPYPGMVSPGKGKEGYEQPNNPYLYKSHDSTYRELGFGQAPWTDARLGGIETYLPLQKSQGYHTLGSMWKSQSPFTLG